MPNEHAQLLARDTNGPVIQLLRNLQGPHGSEWLAAVNRFLRKENPWPPLEPLEIKQWLTLNLRRYATSKKLLRALKRADYSFYESSLGNRHWSEDFLIQTQDSEAKITKVSVYDLGFRVGGYFSEILTRAHDLELELLPVELLEITTALVALAYDDKPFHEILEIPVPGPSYGPSEVSIIGEGKVIKSYRRLGRDFILPETKMIFMCPKVGPV